MQAKVHYEELCEAVCSASMNKLLFDVWLAFQKGLEAFVAKDFKTRCQPIARSDVLMVFELRVDHDIKKCILAFLPAAHSRSGARKATQTFVMCKFSWHGTYDAHMIWKTMCPHLSWT